MRLSLWRPPAEGERVGVASADHKPSPSATQQVQAGLLDCLLGRLPETSGQDPDRVEWTRLRCPSQRGRASFPLCPRNHDCPARVCATTAWKDPYDSPSAGSSKMRPGLPCKQACLPSFSCSCRLPAKKKENGAQRVRIPFGGRISRCTAAESNGCPDGSKSTTRYEHGR